MAYFAQTLEMREPHVVKNNELSVIIGEKLKNTIEDKKNSEAQKLMTELYVQLFKINPKDGGRHVLNKYLKSMINMERVVLDEDGPKRLEFHAIYKTIDKDVLKYLEVNVEMKQK